MGSNIIFMALDIAIISPEFKHNFLLSSKTVFMFSIQTASIGPSNTNHFLSSSSALANYLNFTAKTPSYHSWDTSSNYPYNSFIVIDLGFIVIIWTFFSFIYYLSFKVVNAPAKTLIADVFPPKGKPTTIKPCLTKIIS